MSLLAMKCCTYFRCGFVTNSKNTSSFAFCDTSILNWLFATNGTKWTSNFQQFEKYENFVDFIPAHFTRVYNLHFLGFGFSFEPDLSSLFSSSRAAMRSLSILIFFCCLCTTDESLSPEASPPKLCLV